ncbi:MAG TPA: hypothetical protein VNY05_08300 [Candidatus Acidoferrales bacterium]|jgi:hypothetical protein|nr:hypothetical protein [Candidatus Acidoferrales bacterium]
MAKGKKKEQAPRVCRDCENWPDVQERVRVSEALESAIQAVETKIKAKDFKPTMAEYLKLMQVEKELKHDDTKEIRVTWVEAVVKPEPEK